MRIFSQLLRQQRRRRHHPTMFSLWQGVEMYVCKSTACGCTDGTHWLTGWMVNGMKIVRKLPGYMSMLACRRLVGWVAHSHKIKEANEQVSTRTGEHEELLLFLFVVRRLSLAPLMVMDLTFTDERTKWHLSTTQHNTPQRIEWRNICNIYNTIMFLCSSMWAWCRATIP